MEKTHYKTIVISDVHLGTSGSKAREVVDFLKHNTCDLLILNGDIIDGWQLKKYGAWKRKHTRFIRTVMKMVESRRTQVVYTRGNHDDFLDQVIPLRVGKRFYIQRDFIYESAGKRYLVTHGDVFDNVTSHSKWVAHLGDLGYTFLLWLNKVFNRWRAARGLPYYSLSQKVKAKVKQAVSYISDYETKLVELAVAKKCDGVICGHIHQPAIRQYGKIEYLNSGDWVESLSALVEDYEGNWSLKFYAYEPGQMVAEEEEEVLPHEEDFADEATMAIVRKQIPGLKGKPSERPIDGGGVEL